MRLLACFLVLALAVPAAARGADDLAKRKQEVKRKSDEAQALLKDGKPAEAGARFEEGYAVLPDLALLFAAATAYGRAWDTQKDVKALRRAVVLLEQLVEQDVVRKQSALGMLGQYKPLLMREEQKAKDEETRKVEEIPRQRARLAELVKEGTAQFGHAAFDEAARSFLEAHALAVVVAPDGLPEPPHLLPWQLLLAAGNANAEVWKKSHAPDPLRKAVAAYRMALAGTKDPAALAKITTRLGPLEEELDAIEVTDARGLEACRLVERLLERDKLPEAEQVVKRLVAVDEPDRALFVASLRLRARLAARRSANALEPRKDLEDAVGAWRALLTLEPASTLPASADAVERRTLEIAQRGMQSRKPIKLALLRSTKPRPDGVAIRLEVASDPLALIKRIQVRFRYAELAWDTREAPIEAGGTSILVPLGPDSKLQLVVVLLGERRAHLIELGTDAAPLAGRPGEIASFEAGVAPELK